MAVAGIRVRWLACLGPGLLLASTPAMADTLREALSQTNASNPLLQAARARQRGVDETVPIERAAGLPWAQLSVTYKVVKKSANSFTEVRTGRYRHRCSSACRSIRAARSGTPIKLPEQKSRLVRPICEAPSPLYFLRSSRPTWT